jgi:alpha-soluble NSF attachment protein
MAKAQKTKALEYSASAEKTLAKRGGWFSSSKDKNNEDAAELFLQAANAYKVGGLQHEAGDAYVRAAVLYKEMTSGSDAAKAYAQAGACYKKSHPGDAVIAYQEAVGILTDLARLTQAAKLCKECAELYEQEELEVEGKSSIVLAIEAYEQASELFSLEDSKSQASACQAKVAELCSAALDPPDLLRAAQIYEVLGRKCLDSALLKYNAKGYFLQSVLCHLANSDVVAAQDNLAKYEGLDYTFTESREGKFVSKLVEAVEGMDGEALATTCFEYDRITKLDPWKTTMLVRVKRSISDDAGGDEEDDFDLT